MVDSKAPRRASAVDEDSARAELFAGSKRNSRIVTADRAPAAATASAASTMHNNRQKLQQRGEALDAVADKVS